MGIWKHAAADRNDGRRSITLGDREGSKTDMMKLKETVHTLLLTKKQAGRELAVSERTVHALLQQGLLPVVRFGGSVRIDRSDLLAFIERQKVGGNRDHAAEPPETPLH